MKIINRYHFFARYIPGIISIIPISILYFFVTKEFNQFELKEYFQSATFLIGISFTFIFNFFVSVIVREFGCILENKYYKNRKGFPTSYLMTLENTKLPFSIKEQYRKKIKDDFQIILLCNEEEKNNPQESIKLLNHATTLISTKYQQNEQIINANIAYGISRNICGGLFISLPTAFLSIIIGYILKNNGLVLWSSVLSVIFILIAFFHKQWINRNAEKYAEKLFAIYLMDSPIEK